MVNYTDIAILVTAMIYGLLLQNCVDFDQSAEFDSSDRACAWLRSPPGIYVPHLLGRRNRGDAAEVFRGRAKTLTRHAKLLESRTGSGQAHYYSELRLIRSSAELAI